MYRIIRAAKYFETVIVVSPPDATPDTQNTKFYRYVSAPVHDCPFSEIDKETAMRYFSGQADGMGFEMLPKEPFLSLDDVLWYINEKRSELYKKRLEERGLDSEEAWEAYQREYMSDPRLRKRDPDTE